MTDQRISGDIAFLKAAHLERLLAQRRARRLVEGTDALLPVLARLADASPHGKVRLDMAVITAAVLDVANDGSQATLEYARDLVASINDAWRQVGDSITARYVVVPDNAHLMVTPSGSWMCLVIRSPPYAELGEHTSTVLTQAGLLDLIS